MSRTLPTAVALAFALLPAVRAADPTPVEPFNGKNLSGWKIQNKDKSNWIVGTYTPSAEAPGTLAIRNREAGEKPDLVNWKAGGCNISTEERYGDVTVEVEFMIPKGSNSGAYLMGEYEVQIIDSTGKPDDQLKPGDMGGIYTFAAPKKNAGKKPGEWQKFVIDFQAPKFDADGKKTADAKFLKVALNDVVIHENVVATKPTPGGLTGKEAATGPLMFQGDHGPIALRNIKITPRK